VTWVAWRVQRPQLLAALGAVAMLGIWLAATGLVTGHDQTWKYLTDGDVYVLYALPGLLGLALGTPLVAGETDRGTQRLAWTQSMTRTRWLVFKLYLSGLAVAVLSAALTGLLEWWTRAVSLAASTDSGGFSGIRIEPAAFDLTGMVVVGYTLFAFLLGAALGAVVRRPGWAFALGIPVFAVARVVVEDWVRPHLVAPITYATLSGIAPKAVLNGWLLNSGFVPAGRTSPAPGQTWQTSPPQSYVTCTDQARSPAADAHCAALAHVHVVYQFQPASHYWALQAAETAIFAGLGLLLLGVTVIAVRRWAS
jgi:ABC-type transport system involved in multi-copper enzyme maturation permease subunit